jgi:predicted enzyme related to lactoylglutathione lyase
VYAKNARQLVEFYTAVVGMRQVHTARDLIVLEADGVQLLVRSIPEAIAATFTVSVPPRPREDAALKFFFTVPSLDEARRAVVQLGGDFIGDRYIAGGFRVSNAYDPEGNIFHLREPR